MRKYSAVIELKDSELKDVLNQMDQAMEQIRNCYFRLAEMGVLKFKEEPAPQVEASDAG